jgi:hypothetical protein
MFHVKLPPAPADACQKQTVFLDGTQANPEKGGCRGALPSHNLASHSSDCIRVPCRHTSSPKRGLSVRSLEWDDYESANVGTASRPNLTRPPLSKLALVEYREVVCSIPAPSGYEAVCILVANIVANMLVTIRSSQGGLDFRLSHTLPELGSILACSACREAG